MTTLFNKYLCEREFGSAVLHVETFQKWAVAKGLHLRTAPALGEYEFAQVESLLCAIEQGAAPQTPEDARAIIDSKPELAGHNVAVRFPEPDHSHVWLVGAEAHLQWRRLIERAITDDELQLLDGASYLPVSSRLAASPEAPKCAEPKDATPKAGNGEQAAISWQEQARQIADELFSHDTNNNCRDCLIRKNSRGEIIGGYAYRVMEEMQKRNIHGPRGRFDNAGTISREALQGNKWWARKPK